MSLDAAQAALEQSQRELSNSREEIVRQEAHRIANRVSGDKTLDRDLKDSRNGLRRKQTERGF